MSQYLTSETFRDLYGTFAQEDFDDLRRKTGDRWLDAQFRIVSDMIDVRLRKRYATPFAAPFPDIVCKWAAALVSPTLLQRMRYAPDDIAVEFVAAEHAATLEALKECANSNEGLYELPLRRDATGDAIVNGGPLAYSEPGPYDWMDRQMEALDR